MKEIWKDVPDYEGLYKASNSGLIFGVKRQRLVKPNLNRHGYYTLTLSKNNKRNTRSVHRLVATAFLGKSNLVINHKDGVKTNNNICNLEFITIAQNNRHAHEIGLHDDKNKKLSEKMKQMKSEDSNCSKLTEKQVIRIRELLKEGKTNISISKIYSVTASAISNIKRNKAWNKMGKKYE